MEISFAEENLNKYTELYKYIIKDTQKIVDNLDEYIDDITVLFLKGIVAIHVFSHDKNPDSTDLVNDPYIAPVGGCTQLLLPTLFKSVDDGVLDTRQVNDEVFEQIKKFLAFKIKESDGMYIHYFCKILLLITDVKLDKEGNVNF